MNYTNLVQTIKDFLEDDSEEFSNEIPIIVTQAERIIFQRLPSLPCFRKVTTGTLSVGTSDYTIASARMIRNVSVTSSSNIIYLNHRVDSYLRDYWPNSSTTGTPVMYSTKNATTSGLIITLAPTPSATLGYTVEYSAPETGLSDSNANSWIGDNAENVLLSASLYESSAFLKSADTLKLYKEQFEEAVTLFQQEMGRNYTSEYEGGI